MSIFQYFAFASASIFYFFLTQKIKNCSLRSKVMAMLTNTKYNSLFIYFPVFEKFIFYDFKNYQFLKQISGNI